MKNGCGDLKNGSGDLFKQTPFDVIILGQSVDDAKKGSLVEAFRRYSSAPIISVPCKADEPTDGADIHAEPDPEELLRVIANLVQGQNPAPGCPIGLPVQRRWTQTPRAM